MNPYATFVRELIPVALLLAIVLNIALFITLTVIRFGWHGFLVKNLSQVISSRTMLIAFALYIIFVFLFAVDRFLFLKELDEKDKTFRETIEKIEEKIEKLRGKQKGSEKESKEGQRGKGEGERIIGLSSECHEDKA